MIVIAAVCTTLLVLYLLFFLENGRFKTTHTACTHEKIGSHFRIVQVSDLHDRRFGEQQQKLIQAIRTEKPDLIVVTGDLFNRHHADACENAFLLVRQATGIAPVYFIEGNHECSLKKTGERYIKKISKMGVCVLRNTYTDLAQCRLIGLKQHAPEEKLSAMLHETKFNLVLAHRPERFPLYAQTGADVVLSGHAHGGQIRIGHRGLYAPQQGVLPKYSEGWYRIGTSRLFVSRGLGNTIAFPRVLNTPELAVIDFYPQTEKES